MNALFTALERASIFGLIALLVVYGLQLWLDDKVPAVWRVWIWRVAVLQMALTALPLASIDLAILPAKTAPIPSISKFKEKTPMALTQLRPSTTNNEPSKIARKSTDVIAQPKSADSASEVVSNPTSIQSVTEDAISKPNVLTFDKRLPLLILYGCGILWHLLILGRATLRVRRMLGACEVLENREVEAQMRQLGGRFSIRQLPRLLRIESGAPLLVGVFRPTIVLPQKFLDAPDSALEPVLAHELAHLKRRDLWWNPLLWLIQTLFWFHPLSWASRHYLSLEIESACDEAVLSQTRIAPRSYGTLLLQTATKIESTPLVAGVSDGFNSLCKRISRLERAPKTPKLISKISFVLALVTAFVVTVPFRLVARAQVRESKQAIARLTISHPIKGIVRDVTGKPVANATIYALKTMRNGEEPIETVKSDADGHFQFSIKPRAGSVELFADAGKRGMGRVGTSNIPEQPLNVSPAVRAHLRFLDPQKRPVAGLKVRLWRVGPSVNSWMALPKTTLNSMQATTDAKGVAVFPPLPDGMTAQFILDDQISKKTRFGLGDLRGRRFAPLSTEDIVFLSAPQVSQTIQLKAVAEINGQITYPDGKNAGNVLVMARRINQAEERGGEGNEIDWNIAQTRSNAAGRYVLEGLRPGKYWLWIYPEKRLARDWVGPTMTKIIASGSNLQNFALSRGALIDGTVISQQSKQPVKGQTMGLEDSQGNYQYDITDANGHFSFRVLGGKQHLWVHANGTNSPPAGYILPNKSEFDFTITNDQQRNFKIELPGEPFVKLRSGTVIGPDGDKIANARVWYRLAGNRGNSSPNITKTDAEGHFSLPKMWSAEPVQLLAESGNLTASHSTIVVGQREILLQLERNVWASLEGKVLGENRQPIAEAPVTIYTIGTSIGGQNKTTTTDKEGRFQFSRLRPGTGVMITANRSGFSTNTVIVNMLQTGQKHSQNVVLRRAIKTLTGVVLKQDGTPAPNFQIWATGQEKATRTKNNGRFFLPQIVDGPVTITVVSAEGSSSEAFRAKGGDKNLTLRLGKGLRQTVFTNSKQWSVASLIGKTAPEIRAAKWSNNTVIPLASLRGKVVLLAFGAFNFNPNYEVGDFARSVKGRVEVLGIQSNFKGRPNSRFNVNLDESANNLGFPLALDSLPQNVADIGGQTFAAYKNAMYAVIGRDGKILYAGDELNRAITFAVSE